MSEHELGYRVGRFYTQAFALRLTLMQKVAANASCEARPARVRMTPEGPKTSIMRQASLLQMVQNPYDPTSDTYTKLFAVGFLPTI